MLHVPPGTHREHDRRRAGRLAALSGAAGATWTSAVHGVTVGERDFRGHDRRHGRRRPRRGDHQRNSRHVRRHCRPTVRARPRTGHRRRCSDRRRRHPAGQGHHRTPVVRPAAGDGEIAASTGSAARSRSRGVDGGRPLRRQRPRRSARRCWTPSPGEVCFGPVVRLADGGLQRYGARPVNGAVHPNPSVRRSAAASAATSTPARSPASSRRSPASRRSRTVLRHAAVQIPKRSTKPRCVPLSRCTLAIERSRARTSSTSPVNPPPCWRGHGVW